MTDLTRIPIEKRPDTLHFEGRILWLVDDAPLLRAQLFEGRELTLEEAYAAGFRDQISTDEITPAYICYFFDETLGEFPYLGLRATNPETGEQEAPITRNAVKEGGFVCSVAGRRRGKGSSREQSPYAELMAGIRVVVGESIERIYNENCQNLGILTTTDFSVIERIESGEEIPLAVFTEGTDEITREIIEYGGLFEFNLARLRGAVTLPPARAMARAMEGPDRPGSPRPMTVAEKIFARKWVVDASRDHLGVPAVEPGEAGFFRTDIRFSHE
ncbi:MAG: hypothetical protein RQ745_04480, partial [Longimicrobiales bacterium]|nr:hypothetical protein [Longimicrobiales bacterium]